MLGWCVVAYFEWQRHRGAPIYPSVCTRARVCVRVHACVTLARVLFVQGVSHWIQLKVATAFQWMSPVNQGNYFEGIKSLEGLTKTGWATEDASARITT